MWILFLGRTIQSFSQDKQIEISYLSSRKRDKLSNSGTVIPQLCFPEGSRTFANYPFNCDRFRRTAATVREPILELWFGTTCANKLYLFVT